MRAGLWLVISSICWGLVVEPGVAEKLRFCSLKQGQYALPSLTAPVMFAKHLANGTSQDSRSSGVESFRLAQEDYLARMKRRPRLHEEIWTTGVSGKPEQATLCVIHTLTETAGLSFLFPNEKAGPATFEIRIPKGPGLGPFSLSLNGKELETIDPWAREKTRPEWVSLKQPVELTQGINTLTITQRSPQDLPIWVEALRITAQGK